MKRKINAYLAGPIFTIRDRWFNAELERRILEIWPELNLYLPQNNKVINDKTKAANSKQIYDGDMERLSQTDLLITVVSGDMPPIGTTCEIGIYSEMQKANKHKHLVALYDDNRNGSTTYCDAKLENMRADIAENQWHYINLFLVGCIKSNGKLVGTLDEFIEAIKKEKEYFDSLGNDE